MTGSLNTDKWLTRTFSTSQQSDLAREKVSPALQREINGHANARGRHREFAMASGEMTDELFRNFLDETLGAATAVSRDGAVHFVCPSRSQLGWSLTMSNKKPDTARPWIE